MSDKRFIKFIDSEPAEFLLLNHHNAFLLLCWIAKRARRYSGHVDGLEIGEAKIGDWNSYGFTRQEYRTALTTLCKLNFIKILETNRTRKKSTTGATTEGTKVKLLDTRIWDINSEDNNHRYNHCPTTAQPLPNHELRKNKKDKKEERKEEMAEPAKPTRPTNVIFFSFENRKFEGITPRDLLEWKETYPSANVEVELKKMVQWCLSNESDAKSKKKWRAFITRWLNSENEKSINRKAYESRMNGSHFPSKQRDRITKDIHGNPVESPYEGRF